MKREAGRSHSRGSDGGGGGSFVIHRLSVNPPLFTPPFTTARPAHPYLHNGTKRETRKMKFRENLGRTLNETD